MAFQQSLKPQIFNYLITPGKGVYLDKRPDFMTESYRDRTLAVHWSNTFGGWVAFVDGQIVKSKAGVSISQKSITARQAGRRWIRKHPKNG